ncbi:MAG: glyoxalase [Chloroflexi bacterium]|nr:MAG: glyoxalase [Chloroflexota bacterium]
MIQPTLHHIALTVTDLDASIAWYEKVFGITYRTEVGHEGGTGKLLSDDSRQLVIVLHRHDDNQAEMFKETRTGLDHVGLAVASRSDLEAWQAHLKELGVEQASPADRPLTQSPILDPKYASVLVFRDPDNIQLELFAPRRV